MMQGFESSWKSAPLRTPPCYVRWLAAKHLTRCHLHLNGCDWRLSTGSQESRTCQQEPDSLLCFGMDADTPLATATDPFRSRLGAVTDPQLDSASPCEGWTVRDLVAHVIGGKDMAV